MYEQLPEARRPLRVHELYQTAATRDQLDSLEKLHDHFLSVSDRIDRAAAVQFGETDVQQAGFALGRNCQYNYTAWPAQGVTVLAKVSDEGEESLSFREHDGITTVQWQPSPRLLASLRVGSRDHGPLLKEISFFSNPALAADNAKLAAEVQRLVQERTEALTSGFVSAVEKPKDSRLKRLGQALLRGGLTGTGFRS